MTLTRRLPTLLAALLLAAACGDDDVGASASDGGSSGAATTDDGATSDSPTTGGGSGSATGGTGDINPWDDPVQCHSGKTWTMGEIETPLMHPGRACLDCHAQQLDEPEVQSYLQLAGTVYDFGHDPDDCYGVDGGADPITVEITDAMMAKFTLPVGPSGNFMITIEDAPVAFPITALVRRGDAVRAMGSAQQTGDCNLCHTQAGTNGAPGRIVAP